MWFSLLSSYSPLPPPSLFSSLFLPPLLSPSSSATPCYSEVGSHFAVQAGLKISFPVSISQILGLQTCGNIPILNPRICFVSSTNREEHKSAEASWRVVWKSVSTVFKRFAYYASFLRSTQHFLVIMDYVPFKTASQSKSHPLPSFLSGVLPLW